MDKSESGLSATDFSALPNQDALPQLLLGLCDYLGKRLGLVANYQDLLADELEGKSGLASYSAKSRDLSLEMQKTVNGVSVLLADAKRYFERLLLLPVLEGAASKFSKILPADFSVQVNVPDDIQIRGDAFQLQALIYEIWQILQQKWPAANWEVSAQKMELTHQLKVSLGLNCPEGHYVLLSIVRAGADIEQLLKGHTLLDCLDTGAELPFGLTQVLHWAGIISAHAGDAIFNPQDFRLGMALLLPQLSSEPAAEETAIAWDAAEAGGKTILLVDDEDMIWDVISAMLQELGYQVLLAENGQEAVEIYRRNPGQIDLVLLDMIMPTMSGAEAFFLLKAIDPAVKVLLSSGYVSEDEIQEVLNAGAVGFLSKPYRMADLARKVKNIFAGA